jgi:hypothetical protein
MQAIEKLAKPISGDGGPGAVSGQTVMMFEKPKPTPVAVAASKVDPAAVAQARI